MNKKGRKEIWWKLLIVLTFIISLSCLYILSDRKEILPKYKYRTIIIELDNSNTLEYFKGKIVKYVCDEGVYFNKYDWGKEGGYYASTWYRDGKRDPKLGGMKGKCMIKIREKI